MLNQVELETSIEASTRVNHTLAASHSQGESAQPQVSVLMSVYNGNVQNQLCEAVESIIGQTFSELEFIIVDDASTDDTWQVLSDFAVSDQRIVLVRNEQNIGLTKSLNKGLTLAQGKYVARQDADDVSFPTRLSLQVSFLEQNPEVGIVGTAVQLIYPSGDKLWSVHPPTDHKTLRTRLLFNNYHCFFHPTLLVRMDLLKQLDGYETRLRYAQDYDLLWRACNIAQVHVLSDVLAYYRVDNVDAITSKHSDDQQMCALQISMRAMHQLSEQDFDEEAYCRFWRAYHGHMERILRGDVIRLLPLWKGLASKHSEWQGLGSLLLDFARRLANDHPLEGLQMLHIVNELFGEPIPWVHIAKALVRPWTPSVVRQILRRSNRLRRTAFPGGA